MPKKKEIEFVEDEVVIRELPANIAFIGDESAKPLLKINAQGKHLKLPPDQSKPFWHEDASYIIRHFPNLYKPVVEKGGK